MTPGTYLRKRRLAAAVSIEEAAALLVADGIAVPADWARLEAIETDQAEPTFREVYNLRLAFDFDIDVLHQTLVQQPHQVCRECGCSWHDPCENLTGQACSWVEDNGPGEEGLCSCCAEGSVS